MGKLTAQMPVHLEANPSVTVKAPAMDEAPVDYLSLIETYRNCSPEKGSFKFTHNEEQSVGHVIKKQKVVRTGTSYTIGIKFSYTYQKVFTTELTGSLTNNSEVTITNARDDNFLSSKRFTFELPVTVPANTLLTVRHDWIKRIVPVQYSGKVRADAPLTANLADLKLVSEVLKAPESREFEFAGVFEFALVYEGKTDVQTKPLTPGECASAGITVSRESPNATIQ